MADGDTVPALPGIRTRVGTFSSRQQGGLILSGSPDGAKVGTMIGSAKRWADFTPTSVRAGGPAVSPTSVMAATPAPAQLFEQTPTPLDTPYYQPGFGFGLPGTTVVQSMQPMQTMQPVQTMQTMQPQMMQTMQMMPPMMMQPQMMQPQMMQPQMVMMAMVPAPMNQVAPVSVMDQPVTGSKAGRQLLSEAFDGAGFDYTSQAVKQAVVLNGFNGLQPGQVETPGSALHGTGRCNPCAWFWKPKGCQNAANCSYCHLCPEGELKQRKKAKVTAMRMGALEPSSQDGAPPQLNLTELLG